MKVVVDSQQLVSYGKSLYKISLIVVSVFVVLAFLVLTYFAIMPQEDLAAKEAGRKVVDSLDLQFNQKLLKELSGTSNPTSVSDSGGRDPFSPF